MQDKNKMVSELFALGAHFGYSKSKRHPSVKEFLFSSKNEMDIINLEKTVEQILKAKNKLNEIFSKDGKIIFLGNKAIIKDLTPDLAKREEILYVSNRWIGGTITNFSEIKKRILRLQKLMDEKERGEFSKYVKKEILQKDKEIEKLKKYYFGLLNLKELPRAIVVIDGRDEEIAIKEARDKGIDTIVIGSTDNNISEFTYPILANDRSRKVVDYIIKQIFE